MSKASPDPSKKLKSVIIYTDGSSRGNPGPGGYGTVLIAGKHRKEISIGFKRTTNNRMELMAALAGLRALQEPCDVTIYTDSRYLTDAFLKNWIKGWKKKSWKTSTKKPVKNKDLWLGLDAANDMHAITWTWVKGHAGNLENERCDFLATEAAQGRNLRVDEGFSEE